MRRRARVLAALFLAFALVVTACSGDDDSAEPADADTRSPAGAPTTGAPDGDGDDSTATTLPASSGDFEAEEVEFSTPDGVLLAGTMFGPGTSGGGIVLAHMRGADRSTWEPFAEVAASNGFRVLTLTFAATAIPTASATRCSTST